MGGFAALGQKGGIKVRKKTEMQYYTLFSVGPLYGTITEVSGAIEMCKKITRTAGRVPTQVPSPAMRAGGQTLIIGQPLLKRASNHIH